MAKLAADTIEDFVKAAAAKWGKGRMGETTPGDDWTYSGFSKGRIGKLSFTVKPVVEYAEEGGGKPDAENRKAIKEVAKLAKEHELNHKKSYEKALKDWKPEQQAKEVMAETYDSKAEAEKAMKAKFAELQKELLNACLDLHKKEGTVVWDRDDDDGTITVKMVPTGPSGCK